jgi:predicted nucleotidyltransferase
MKTAGLIAEFNPFHNGHAYIINEIKKDADALVCVMSGSFTQRGHVAVCSKWARTRAALFAGVDLVIELPAVYSVNTAQKFAYGGIYLLNALGIVDVLYFGSECGDLTELSRAANLISNEPPEISKRLTEYLSQGMSYPSARQKAYAGTILPTLLSEPNNILAIEYIRALSELKSRITPRTVSRNSAGHHDSAPCGTIASASSIRAMLASGADARKYMPAASYKSLKNDLDRGAAPYKQENLSRLLLHTVRTGGADFLRTINDVSEGLENRIISACRQNSSFNAIAEAVKSKRYTRSRIDRVLTSSILGLTSSMSEHPPEYIRVLGLTKTGAEILSSSKKQCCLPIITKLADFRTNSVILEKDLLASDTARLCLDDISSQPAYSDYTTSPIILP